MRSMVQWIEVNGPVASENAAAMNSRMRRVFLGITLAILVGASSAGEVQACPNCKEAVNSSEGEVSSAAMGYNWSIALMLAVPFSMLGTGMLVIRRAVKRGALPEM
jgi:hypothetical protein